jgi:hypothetical protein
VAASCLLIVSGGQSTTVENNGSELWRVQAVTLCIDLCSYSMRKSLFLLFSILTMTSCTLSTGEDCGPFPERSSFFQNDSIAIPWPAASLRVAVPKRLGKVEIATWAHADSILVFATHHGESSFDTLTFEHLVIEDTVLQLRLLRASETSSIKGPGVECSPAPDPSFETDLKIFAPEGVRVTYGPMHY